MLAALGHIWCRASNTGFLDSVDIHCFSNKKLKFFLTPKAPRPICLLQSIGSLNSSSNPFLNSPKIPKTGTLDLQNSLPPYFTRTYPVVTPYIPRSYLMVDRRVENWLNVDDIFLLFFCLDANRRFIDSIKTVNKLWDKKVQKRASLF